MYFFLRYFLGGADVPVGTGFVLSIDGVEDGTTEITLVKGETYSLEMKFTASGTCVYLNIFNNLINWFKQVF